ncbi:MAG: hypothetical protein LBT55_03755 [Clostridiaceae bacterium]|jgi:hypothetical protein|nr:hypothetical protein [Clostridiaceae bacterium]
MKHGKNFIFTTAVLSLAATLLFGLSACSAKEKRTAISEAEGKEMLSAALNDFKEFDAGTNREIIVTMSEEYFDGDGNKEEVGESNRISIAKTGTGAATVMKMTEENLTNGDNSVTYYGKASDGKFYRASESREKVGSGSNAIIPSAPSRELYEYASQADFLDTVDDFSFDFGSVANSLLPALDAESAEPFMFNGKLADENSVKISGEKITKKGTADKSVIRLTFTQTEFYNAEASTNATDGEKTTYIFIFTVSNDRIDIISCTERTDYTENGASDAEVNSTEVVIKYDIAALTFPADYADYRTPVDDGKTNDGNTDDGNNDKGNPDEGNPDEGNPEIPTKRINPKF